MIPKNENTSQAKLKAKEPGTKQIQTKHRYTHTSQAKIQAKKTNKKKKQTKQKKKPNK